MTMGVFRVEKNKNYTVMANFHLRDKNLSLKAVGLLSKMLSLTDEWNYTTRGLAAICKEGVDSIGAALKELENCGYLVRHQLRDSAGKITDTEYIIYEAPHTALPDMGKPDTENPYMDKPDMARPDTGNPAQLSKDITSTERANTKILITDQSNPYPYGGAGGDPMGYDETREIVMENIEYDILVQRYEKAQLDEIVELMTETLCSQKQSLVIAGDEYPSEIVRKKLLKVDSTHIEYVLDCLKQNTTYVHNIKKYMLAALFNAPSTISSYYSALVNHDMYGDGRRGK